MNTSAWTLCPLSGYANESKNSFVNGPFGSDLLTSDLQDSGVPVIYSGDITSGRYQPKKNVFVSESKALELKACHTECGDVIIAKVGTPPCSAAVYDRTINAIVTQDVIRIKPKSLWEGKFLAQLLNSDQGKREAHKIKIAGTRERVSLTEYKKILLPHPPQEEQKKIAQILSTWDQAIAVTEKLIANSEAQKKALMQQLLTGKKRLPKHKTPWRRIKLHKIFTRIKDKNQELNNNILTISAKDGLVSQTDYFNKSVAGKDISNYTLIKKRDFAYNKSYSLGHPMGAIKPLEAYTKGVVSSLYICFRENSSDTDYDFLKHYFNAGIHNKELYNIAQEGARNHGLLNVGINEFFNTSVFIPCIKEQKTIADLMNPLDEELKRANSFLSTLKQEKSALMQQLLTGKRRVKIDADAVTTTAKAG